MPFAPYHRRLFAWIIDALVAALPLIIIAPVWLSLLHHSSGQNNFVAHFLLTLGLGVSWILFQLIALVQALRGLPTLGRRLFGLRIVDNTDAPLSWRAAWLRSGIGALITSALALIVTPMVLLDPFWSLVDPQQRSLRDRLARTHIVIWAPMAITTPVVPGASSAAGTADTDQT
jgi:uncharacterized RDD family membrane protein YckC